MTRRRGEKSTWSLLFALFGLLFVGVAIFYAVTYNNAARNGVKTDAIIVDIDSYYTADRDLRHVATVEFQVEGVTYRGELNEYWSSMKVGQVIPVYYNPENPNEFVFGKMSWVLLLCFGGMGSVVTFIGLYTGITAIRFNAKLRRLSENGRKITATITEVRQMSNVRINGKYPTTIYCKDEYGHEYKQKFRASPSEYFRTGDLVDVYVEADFFDDYIVDVTSYRPQKPLSEEEEFIYVDGGQL